MNPQACMYQDSVLRRGLKALGDAYTREITEDMVKLWATLTREVTDEQFQFGVMTVLKTPRSFFPTPGLVLEAAYQMPLPRKAPVIREGEFWASGGQREHIEGVVTSNPRMQHETPVRYARRIAILSGLLAPDDNEVALDSSHITTLAPPPEPKWMPYREPRDPGEDG